MDVSAALWMVKGASAAAAALFLVLSARLYVHMLQLEGYKTKGLFHWLFRNVPRAFALTGIAALALVSAQVTSNAAMVTGSSAYLAVQITLAGVLLAVFIAAAVRLKVAQAKKPLQYTYRVRRLYAALSVVSLGVCAGLFVLDVHVLSDTFFYGVAISITPVLQPVVVAAANLLMLPVENGVKRGYLRDAERKLARMQGLIRIGVTGSYGKTSTKFILGTILSEKYSTLVTPSSYNTPMGLTRVIREQLEENHEVFIAEMGARHVGDIAELCALVHPSVGIVTSVGPQHLETFKTLKNVRETKFELIQALPGDGAAFFNADDPAGLAFYERTTVQKYLYGMEHAGALFVRAEDIQTGPFGSRFTLRFSDGAIASAQTRLLGRHNILNISGCAAVARFLGLSAEEIAAGIGKVEPVEHRLNILPTDNGVTVIDDAFNSNPQGVKMAMEVLAGFEGRKIVVTPGMVELGEREAEENRIFGGLLADVADIVMLVGERRTAPIAAGLLEAGFDMRNVHVTNTLDEAAAQLVRIGRKGDVVLFENDLPDNYNE